ncbi:uncharacterized protein LOC124613591 [Schistocerca americana]|uniref:uncharacterized protein LOC124613591 n=1 Tax=Schistocerca americana TaxID=7009 RepID=UPI001F4F4711|nr:uncharacterized protein LOC124613591 [Schistocerca americana]
MTAPRGGGRVATATAAAAAAAASAANEPIKHRRAAIGAQIGPASRTAAAVTRQIAAREPRAGRRYVFVVSPRTVNAPIRTAHYAAASRLAAYELSRQIRLAEQRVTAACPLVGVAAVSDSPPRVMVSADEQPRRPTAGLDQCARNERCRRGGTWSRRDAAGHHSRKRVPHGRPRSSRRQLLEDWTPEAGGDAFTRLAALNWLSARPAAAQTSRPQPYGAAGLASSGFAASRASQLRGGKKREGRAPRAPTRSRNSRGLRHLPGQRPVGSCGERPR